MEYDEQTDWAAELEQAAEAKRLERMARERRAQSGTSARGRIVALVGYIQDLKRQLDSAERRLAEDVQLLPYDDRLGDARRQKGTAEQ